ncbi:hypothetical protein SAMN05216466_12768 [Paraburkholderia phenazinium]|jgi:hypothetical protein|uniref:Uncharacterized protein n=1 Tax=Paraburkholderia phenazinium TaxID=60549 RepID=A0A1G8LX02_9BURK|nr:hypothetical protein [Paraburkholderia phenazinium]SDI12897.1 hypothetical protein SAMN05216466_117159 [Paraburkholderia phenazinium]SDI60241.1 hypothetical protein SAMN05216466_12768 [Paraburkholderia phenazinium]
MSTATGRKKSSASLSDLGQIDAAASHTAFQYPTFGAIISGLALTGAIFVWLLLNAGHAYRIGYLVKFGFQPDALPWSTDQLVYLGYFAQEDYLLPLLGIFVCFASVFAAIFLFGNIARHRAKGKSGNLSSRNKAPSVSLVTFEVWAFWVAAIVLFALMIFSVVPMVLLEPVRSRGAADALREMSAIRHWDIKTMQDHQVQFVEFTLNKGGTIAGVPVSCNDKLCAIYTPSGPIHAHTVPLANVETWSTIDLNEVPAALRAMTVP